MGATIYIDINIMGITPKFIPHIVIGEHELKLEKEGYKLLTRKITIDEKKMISLKLYLEATPETNITETNEEKNIVSEEKKLKRYQNPLSLLSIKNTKSHKKRLKLGNEKVKFDPHWGLFLGYDFGTGFNAGGDAGVGVWFRRFNIY